MYDDVFVYTSTSSEVVATNALTMRIRVHKVALIHADGTEATKVSLFDAATATGTAKIILAANETTDGAADHFEIYAEANFNPPVPFHNLSSTIVGTVTCKVYYTKD